MRAYFLTCPKRSCGKPLTRRKTIHASHTRMPRRWAGFNIVKREYVCSSCGWHGSTIEMLERDIELGGWAPADTRVGVRP